jgi:hypothetical protein
MKLREICAVAALAALAACETPYRATDTNVIVTPGIETTFTTQYPTATNVIWAYHDPAITQPIDWELSGWTTLDEDDYIVSYNMNNDQYYSWYDSDGNWIGTAYVMRDYTTLPSLVNTTVTTHYPGYSITAINRENFSDRTNYEIELKNSDTKVKLLVDANGNIIKQKTKSLY